MTIDDRHIGRNMFPDPNDPRRIGYNMISYPKISFPRMPHYTVKDGELHLTIPGYKNVGEDGKLLYVPDNEEQLYTEDASQGQAHPPLESDLRTLDASLTADLLEAVLTRIRLLKQQAEETLYTDAAQKILCDMYNERAAFWLANEAEEASYNAPPSA